MKTKTKTISSTDTKLMIGTLALIVASSAALIVTPLNKQITQPVQNVKYFKMYSCVEKGDTVLVQKTSFSKIARYQDGCQKFNSEIQNYDFSCVKKWYRKQPYLKITWTKCLATQYTCTDSDRGKDIYNYGFVVEKNNYTNEIKKGIDSCLATTTADIQEFYCDGDRIQHEDLSCPEGLICYHDKCQKVNN